MGPALFSLDALACLCLPKELEAKLTGRGWCLDDGVLVGPAEAVHEALVVIEKQPAEAGLVLNKAGVLSAEEGTWGPNGPYDAVAKRSSACSAVCVRASTTMHGAC